MLQLYIIIYQQMGQKRVKYYAKFSFSPIY